MGNHSKRLQEAQAAVRRGMWIKRGIPLGLLAFWTAVLLLLIGFRGSPEDWQTVTVQLARLEEQQVRRWSRYGSTKKLVDVLVAQDGREFRLQDAAQIRAQLSPGETCSIVYESALGQVMHIRALSTAEDGVLVDLQDSVTAHQEVLRLMWWLLIGVDALLLVVLALMEKVGMKTERMLRARLTEQLSAKTK